jgi:hypothetical protein
MSAWTWKFCTLLEPRKICNIAKIYVCLRSLHCTSNLSHCLDFVCGVVFTNLLILTLFNQSLNLGLAIPYTCSLHFSFEPG